jgi:hypothetical protein
MIQQVRELNRLRAGAELDEPALVQLRFGRPQTSSSAIGWADYFRMKQAALP